MWCNMKVLLIGANGQLGTDISEVFSKKPDMDLIPLTDRDIDVTDAEGTERVVRSHVPEVIVNTAAFVNVDACEDDMESPFSVNAISQGPLCRLCREMDMVYVWFSTDYVFDGNQDTPYREDDKPQPLNIYGSSKLAGENIIRTLLKKYYIVRVSGLYGVAGPVGKKYNFVDKIWEKGQRGEEIAVVDDQRLTPTSTRDVAEKLSELIPHHEYGLYHMTNSGDCTWFEFAREIIRLGGFGREIRRVQSGYFGEKAVRPAYSVLDNARLREVGLSEMRSWEEALEDYVQRKFSKEKG